MIRVLLKVFVILLGLLLFSCTKDKGIAPEVIHYDSYKVIGNVKLQYDVSFGLSDPSICSVKVQILEWPDSQNVLFQYPKYYTDNPMYPLADLDINCFRAIDSMGKTFEVKSASFATEMSPFKAFIAPFGTRKIEYVVSYGSNGFGIPFPGTLPKTFLFDGSYIFVLPVVGKTYTEQWRNSVGLTLKIHSNEKAKFIGQDSIVSLENNYELMFVRGAVNPGYVGLHSFRNKNIYIYNTSTNSIDTSRYEPIIAAIDSAIEVLSDSIFDLPHKNLYVGIANFPTAIEGVQGFWVAPSYSGDRVVMLHEFLHMNVGILNGEINDPWWKEGVTTYLHKLLSFHRNLGCEISDLSWEIRNNSTINNFTLRNCHRNELFSPMGVDFTWQVNNNSPEKLIYTKGAQAAMQIDWFIMKNSSNKKNIFDLVQRLSGNTATDAFNAEELNAGLVSLTDEGSNVSTFLKSILETQGTFKYAALDTAYQYVFRRNVYQKLYDSVESEVSGLNRRSSLNIIK